MCLLLAGYLEYLSESGMRTALGMLQGYVANQGDAWQFTLNALAEYYRKASKADDPVLTIPRAPLLTLCEGSLPDDGHATNRPLSRCEPRCWAEGPRSFTWPWHLQWTTLTSRRSHFPRQISEPSRTPRCDC